MEIGLQASIDNEKRLTNINLYAEQNAMEKERELAKCEQHIAEINAELRILRNLQDLKTQESDEISETNKSSLEKEKIEKNAACGFLFQPKNGEWFDVKISTGNETDKDDNYPKAKENEKFLDHKMKFVAVQYKSQVGDIKAILKDFDEIQSRNKVLEYSNDSMQDIVKELIQKEVGFCSHWIHTNLTLFCSQNFFYYIHLTFVF